MSVWPRIVDEIEKFPVEERSLPVLQPVTPAEVRSALESRYTFDAPVPLETLTEDVIQLLRNWTIHATHPRYFGLFNPSILPAGVVADALVALYNPQLAAWSHAPAANEIEQLTLRTFAGALGFDPRSTLANFTSGGAEANFSAVVTALVYRIPEMAEAGLVGAGIRPVIYLTSESHHSFVKIARMTGMGTDALREVAVAETFTMDVTALEQAVPSDLEAGRLPLIVVGTAGTTGAGLIYPLPKIAETASRLGLWFHVDAAWGGSAVLSPLLKPALAGIERADSVTWDAHKWLSVPMGAGMFFCRHPDAARRAFAISTSYMPKDSGEDALDPYAVSVQWSRRMIGLKVFMALAELGMDGYRGLIERQARMGDVLRRRLAETGWLIRNETPLPVVCFTHPDIQSGRVTTAGVLESIYTRGQVWISEVVLGGQAKVLRACITSYRTDEADIDCLIDELELARNANQWT
jgi:glutamate/tyrosine decarboxylase-like PLP-dependent enzyme